MGSICLFGKDVNTMLSDQEDGNPPKEMACWLIKDWLLEPLLGVYGFLFRAQNVNSVVV